MQEVAHESIYQKGMWRLIWFGPISKLPSGARQDVRVQVFLAELDWEANKHTVSGQLTDNVVTAQVPIGEIPRLHLNSIIIDGRPQPDARPVGSEEKKQRVINCSRRNVTIMRRTNVDRDGEIIIPNHSHRPALEGLFAAFGDGSDPYAIVIPCFEIFRFFYATSSVLAREILTDSFLDPHQRLWNIDRTAMDASGRATLWLRQWMLDADAPFLARFAFDKYALRQAQEVFLNAATIGPLAAGERLLKALPPFEGSVKMKYFCLPLPHGRSLVTRLVTCYWEPPFTCLRWDRDNDGRYDPNDRELREQLNRAAKLPIPESPLPTELRSQAPSSELGSFKMAESEVTDRFPNLGRIPYEKLPQDNTTNRSDMSPEAFFADAYQGSVIDDVSPSRELISPAVIEAANVPLSTPKTPTSDVDLTIGQADYRSVLALLKQIAVEQYASVRFLTILEETTHVEGIAANVFPSEIDGREKAWLYVNRFYGTKRFAIVAAITRGPATRYAIELQQKRVKECSTLIVWTHDETVISERVLRHQLLDCAREAGAKLPHAELFGLEWGRRKHSVKQTGKEAAKHFVELIFSTQPIA